MTVSTATSRVDYTGNGDTTAFAVPFPFIEDSYLTVIRTVIATGVETTLALNSGGADGYTVTGAGQPSGSITVVTAPTAAQRVSIIRAVPGTQEADFVANDPFPAETFEDALDKLQMQINDNATRASRSPVLYDSDIDGSGRYNFKGNRGSNAADGVSATDLATVQQITSAGSGSFVQAGAGSVIRTMQDKARDIVSVKDFGAVGDGVTDDSAAVGLAQAASDSILFPAGAYLFSANVTLTADMIVPSGATLKPANGVTVTVESNIEAGDYTIFDLSLAGLIALAKRARVARLAWFGVSPDATAADNTTAFNNAIDACPASDGIELLFPAGTIQSNGFTVDKSGVTVTGHNAGTWLVNNTTNAPCIEVAVAAGKASWCHLRNLRIGQNASVAPVAGNCGVRLLRTDQTALDDIVCFDFPDNLREGFLFEDADNTTVRNLKAINCTSHGFRWTNAAGGCTDTFGNALLAYGNTGSGFRFEGCSGFYANNLHAYNNNIAFEWPTDFTNQFFFVSSWIGDTSASYNWLIQNLNRSAFAACWAATQQSAAVNTFATGVFISSADAYDITFDGLTVHNNNSNGVQVTNSALDITINGGRSTANGVAGAGSGYRIELATDITIQGARAKGNATNGILTTAVASDYLMIQNNNLRGNTSASLANDSTGLNNQVGTNIV